jgi:hypothetical protein
MAKQISYKIIPLCLGVLAISCLLSYVVLAWTEPIMSPPGGNVAPPLRLINGAASLTDPTHSEGNLTEVNVVIGYNDLFLKGNSAETSPVYLAGNEIKMYTSASERMKIDSSGNVGIGTTEPQYKFHVEGTTKIQADNIFFNINKHASDTLRFFNDSIVIFDDVYVVRKSITIPEALKGTIRVKYRMGCNNDWLGHVEGYICKNGGGDIYSTYEIVGFGLHQLSKDINVDLQPGDKIELKLRSCGFVEVGQVQEFRIYYDESGDVTISGNVGIGQTSPASKFVINDNLSDAGSVDDSLSVYANTAGSAIYAEQQGAGYAGYFKGKTKIEGGLDVSGDLKVKDSSAVLDSLLSGGIIQEKFLPYCEEEITSDVYTNGESQATGCVFGGYDGYYDISNLTPENVKTGVSFGRGITGTLTEGYTSYTMIKNSCSEFVCYEECRHGICSVSISCPTGWNLIKCYAANGSTNRLGICYKDRNLFVAQCQARSLGAGIVEFSPTSGKCEYTADSGCYKDSEGRCASLEVFAICGQ